MSKMTTISTSILNLVKDYSRVSTIGGLSYLFRSDFSLWMKTFWFTVIVCMTALGVYWSSDTFNNWEQNQVQVVVKSAGKLTFILEIN